MLPRFPSFTELCFSQWILYELSVNPRLQQDLRGEISVVGDPLFDDLNRKFPLLDAVLKETLRMHPPISENHHVVRDSIPASIAKLIYNMTVVEI